MFVRSILGALAISAALAGPAAAQHSLGGFLGLTDRDDADLTLGVEYEYRYSTRWSFGGVVEFTPDAIANESATVIMGLAHYHVIDRLKLTGGVGAQFTEFDDDLRFRLGAGYEVFRDETFVVTPRAAVDFGDGDENVVLGVTVALPF